MKLQKERQLNKPGQEHICRTPKFHNCLVFRALKVHQNIQAEVWVFHLALHSTGTFETSEVFSKCSINNLVSTKVGN